MKIESRITQNVVIAILVLFAAAVIVATSSWLEVIGWAGFVAVLFVTQQTSKTAQKKNEVQQ